MTAKKKLAMLDATWSKDMKAIAKAVVEKHEKGTQTLVVLNTVERAKALFGQLQKDKNSPDKRLFVHSRFRPDEREKLNTELQRKDGSHVVHENQCLVTTRIRFLNQHKMQWRDEMIASFASGGFGRLANPHPCVPKSHQPKDHRDQVLIPEPVVLFGKGKRLGFAVAIGPVNLFVSGSRGSSW